VARQPGLFIDHADPSRLAADEEGTSKDLLARVGASVRTKPRAVLAVTPRFVSQRLTVTTSGDMKLARQTIARLLPAGFEAVGDDSRRLDNGVRALLSILFPGEEVPVVEVSLLTSLDSDRHFAMGRALEPLRDDGVLLLASGAVRVETGVSPRAAASKRFSGWVRDLVTAPQPFTRARGLTRFRDHPDARLLSVGESFLPLVVIAGAASSDRSGENVAEVLAADALSGEAAVAYRFAR
jgi:aromatic ring-opening dioxygenase catalytic subunit (LigB family)